MEDINYSRVKNILKEIPFFEDFNEEDLDYLSGQLSLRSFGDGTELFKKGDIGDYLFFIVEGNVKIQLESPFYKSIYATVGRGNSIGEMSLIDEFPRSATIVVTESAELLILTKNRFESINEENPAVGIKLLKGLARSLSKRIRGLSGRFADLA